jgi:type III pantothenate kinase
MSVYLAIDAGNSRLKFGLLDTPPVGSYMGGLPVCRQSLSIDHDTPIPWRTIDKWFPSQGTGPPLSVIAGVRPDALQRLTSGWLSSRWPAPRMIGLARELPIAVRTDAPDRVGIDRLLNAVAVNRLRTPGQPAIVIDSGTATTVDVIAADGAFEGGAILPGLELCARSLCDYTALLPLVPVSELARPDLPALGRDTRSAIAAGLLYGQAGAIRELVARLSAELRDPPLVVVTGGNGMLLAPHLGSAIRVETDLPLKGLVLSVTQVSWATLSHPGGAPRSAPG